MTQINHLQEALKLYDLGYQVIPLCTPNLRGKGCIQHGAKCEHPGKRPLVPWRGRLRVTREEIISWWRRWPGANIGALPDDNRLVLDIDPRHRGWDTLARLGIDPPETVTVLTGGDGEHWHFRTNGRHLKTVGPGLDILKRHTVVLPPSLHHTGKRYRWKPGFGPGDIELAPLPDWISSPETYSRTPKEACLHHGNTKGLQSGKTCWHDTGQAAASDIRENLTHTLLQMGGQFQSDGRILVSCPFPGHQENTPSFYYSPHTGRWWCFGGGHPERKPGQICVSGTAHQLQSALDNAAANEMFISVIKEVLPDNDYRNAHSALSLEQVEGVYQRMVETLESRLEAKEWSTFGELKTLNAIGETIETALGGFVTDRRPGGIRVPCLKDGVQEYVHVFPQGCGNPLCPIHSRAKAEENLRPKWKRLKRLYEPALVLFRSPSGSPRQVAANMAKLQRRKGYPLKDRGWYKFVLPYRPGAQVGILVDLADGEVDLDGLKALWGEEVSLVRLPQQNLYELLREFIRQADFPEAYHSDESYWLDWLLQTRGLQCAWPLGATRKSAGEVGEVKEDDKANHCPHGNTYGKPLGMLTPDQMDRGLTEGYLEETPHGLIEVREVPSDIWLKSPGLHKWKGRAIKRRRGCEARTSAVASGDDDGGLACNMGCKMVCGGEP